MPIYGKNEGLHCSLQQLHRAGDRMMVLVSWLLFGYAMALASWHATWSEALLVGLPAALAATALAWWRPGSVIARTGIGTLFMVLTALHIHQAHGMIEMHFGVFVLLAFLLYYRDWLPIVAAAGTIAAHHLGFYCLQELGYPVYLFDHTLGLGMVLTHAAYVVFETGILVVLAIRLRREAVEAEEVHAAVGSLLAGGARIDLRCTQGAARSPVGRALRDVMDQTRTVLQETRDATTQLDGSSEEMAALAQQLAQRLAAQQGEAEQTVEAMQELAASMQQLVDHADRASAATQQVDQAAQEGTHVLRENEPVVAQLADGLQESAGLVERVNRDSERIGTVLDVISSVSEQTSLLALNAAIEAARAGEQGRGFAVVADEVRTLASRTQQSSREIQAIIETLQQTASQADRAMQESQRAGSDTVAAFQALAARLQTIAEGTQRLQAVNTEVATTAGQQQTLTEASGQRVRRICTASADTRADIRQLADVSGGLRQLAARLVQHTARFDL